MTHRYLKLRLAAVAIGAAVIMASAAALSGGDPVEASADIPIPQTKYLVKEHMGMVAVFSEGGQMIKLTDFPVATLPKADRDELAEGVAIDSDVELALLLEDYSS